ncbi:MAG: hypothetical protein NC039_07580 [Muribaculaceae bacterium]|nr:hypothetical protein [Muribaculaceae bacterium]
MKQIIANARAKYFDKFVGDIVTNKGYSPETEALHPNGWCGMTPDEAMELADKIVDWLYSPHEQTKQED